MAGITALGSSIDFAICPVRPRSHIVKLIMALLGGKSDFLSLPVSWLGTVRRPIAAASH